MSNLDRRPRDGRLTLYMVGMVEQHGLWWHLLADTVELIVAMPKKGFWGSVFYGASSYMTGAVWRTRFSHLERVAGGDACWR
jgi:hypothetical protein